MNHSNTKIFNLVFDHFAKDGQNPFELDLNATQSIRKLIITSKYDNPMYMYSSSNLSFVTPTTSCQCSTQRLCLHDLQLVFPNLKDLVIYQTSENQVAGYYHNRRPRFSHFMIRWDKGIEASTLHMQTFRPGDMDWYQITTAMKPHVAYLSPASKLFMKIQQVYIKLNKQRSYAPTELSRCDQCSRLWATSWRNTHPTTKATVACSQR
ncbi:hypothetical protein BT63DRAFT_421403 [Microthyrium microscopicum]|uniref:Uncharacterized protein n=1 Tax=Microthyrium microscopicum TaxID=703497 RepID=A0A6A6ULS0_9PEZI|nr:hypothetical protein BT63DRAFT_421403 [Microthyrium microscopicum]